LRDCRKRFEFTDFPPSNKFLPQKGALKNLQGLGHGKEYFAGKIFTTDTNYHSDTNLRKCQEMGLDAYVPDRIFAGGTLATPPNGDTGPGGRDLPWR